VREAPSPDAYAERFRHVAIILQTLHDAMRDADFARIDAMARGAWCTLNAPEKNESASLTALEEHLRTASEEEKALEFVVRRMLSQDCASVTEAIPLGFWRVRVKRHFAELRGRVVDLTAWRNAKAGGRSVGAGEDFTDDEREAIRAWKGKE
jgi:hypothetical protein